MKLHPRVTQTAVDLAKRFEGFRPRAGKTPDGRYTIGYGHILGARDKPDQVEISEAEAEFLLKLDLSHVAEEIEAALLAPVNDNQFAALLSFALNIGPDNFKGSSALRRLNEGAYLQAAAALELWRRADFDGETLVVDQLVRRRAVEKALFLAPPEGFTPAPSAVLRPTFDHSVVGAAVAWAAARERTAVSRLVLEGPEVSAGLAIPPGREGEPAPSAAIAAADALTVRLSRILPETEPEAEHLPAFAPAPLALEPNPAPPEPTQPEATTAAASASDVHAIAGAAPETSNIAAEGDAIGATAEAPPTPSTEAPQSNGATQVAGGPTNVGAPALSKSPFEDQPLADFPVADTDASTAAIGDAVAAEPPASLEWPAPRSVEPPPFVADDERASPQERESSRSRLGARIANAIQQGAGPATRAGKIGSGSIFDKPTSPHPSDLEQGESQSDHAARVIPLFERPAFFLVLGIVGLALFVSSIVCMMNKASFSCFLIGVMGVLAIAPAAAFFLFRFLGTPLAPKHADGADRGPRED